MPLSDVEIRAEMGAGRLVIEPPPAIDNVDSSSVDLLLHEEIIVMPDQAGASGVTIDPSNSDMDIMEIIRRFGDPKTISNDNPFRFAPRQMVIAKVFEWISLPPHLAARIEGKSSLARLGLAVHITAPTVQAGYRGRLTLEMVNLGPFTLDLKPGMKVAQLILEHLGLPARDPYHGLYLDKG